MGVGVMASYGISGAKLVLSTHPALCPGTVVSALQILFDQFSQIAYEL